MSWVVDSCVLFDILEGDSQWAWRSASALSTLLPEGLTVCPVTLVELAPAFDGDPLAAGPFLRQVGVQADPDWTWPDTIHACAAWSRLVQARRRGVARKRPIADILIGAFAERFEGLVTRNPQDFRPTFPDLRIIDPASFPDAPNGARASGTETDDDG